jgi:hypothetical protein
VSDGIVWALGFDGRAEIVVAVVGNRVATRTGTTWRPGTFTTPEQADRAALQQTRQCEEQGLSLTGGPVRFDAGDARLNHRWRAAVDLALGMAPPPEGPPEPPVHSPKFAWGATFSGAPIIIPRGGFEGPSPRGLWLDEWSDSISGTGHNID